MVNEATIEAYKAMAKDSECPSMEAQIRENLLKTCEKFAGNEDKFERCLSYLEECASEILEGKNGDVPDEVCFRICRDYFNDEIWKKEDEEEAREKAEAEERAAKNEAKKKAAEEKKAEAAAIKKAAAEARKAETLAREKAEEERKAAELKKMQEEAEREARTAEESKKADETAKAETCPGQLDFFAMLGA
jgi:hypothetical protein